MVYSIAKLMSSIRHTVLVAHKLCNILTVDEYLITSKGITDSNERFLLNYLRKVVQLYKYGVPKKRFLKNIHG